MLSDGTTPLLGENRLAALGSRLGFATLVVLATWVGEEFPSLDPRPWWYQREIAGVPSQYLVVAGTLFLLLPYILSKPPRDLIGPLKASGLWRWSVLSAVTVGMGIALGIIRQSPELFVDWRNWLVIVLITILTARWLSAQGWRKEALTDIAICYGVMSGLSLINWMAGRGTAFYGLRVPLLYGYNVMLAGFAAIVAGDVWLNQRQWIRSRGYLIALQLTAIVCSLVVILGFRRSYWLLLVAGWGMVVWRAIKGRRIRAIQWMRIGLSVLLVGGITLVSFGAEALATRIESINPTSDNEFSNTNEDHLGDLADALEVIGHEPIFGIGIGTQYETIRIADWKTASFEVHNAFLNAWLKFGILGLITYIAFHIRLILAFLRSGSFAFVGSVGAGLYLAAEQVPSLIQTWPYNSLQISIHHAIILAVLLLAFAERPTLLDAENTKASPANVNLPALGQPSRQFRRD